jgi:hypothetical protein
MVNHIGTVLKYLMRMATVKKASRKLRPFDLTMAEREFSSKIAADASKYSKDDRMKFLNDMLIKGFIIDI